MTGFKFTIMSLLRNMARPFFTSWTINPFLSIGFENMSHTLLYIADLDGTLLNNDKKVSRYSRRVINTYLARGGNFTIATARTLATTEKVLAGLPLTIPVVLMNGAAIYDLRQGVYDQVVGIPAKTAQAIAGILEECCITGFMYAIDANRLHTYYDALNTPALKTFHDEAARKYNKVFEPVARLIDQTGDGNIVYFTLMDEYAPLHRIAQRLNGLTGLNVMLYSNIYSDTLWYLEVYSAEASKCHAVQYLRRRYAFDRVIGFGDNLNDLSLFAACDEGYAVANAVQELKDQATGVIGDHNSDGVARFIAEREGMMDD